MNAILDAAAALIRESGVGGLTMDGAAKRAGTSVGSMYHFFPDREAVIAGLAERHLRTFEPVLAALAGRSKTDWQQMSAADVVDALLTPILHNLRAFSHVLLLAAEPEVALRLSGRTQEMGASLLGTIEKVLSLRQPGISAQVRRARAIVIATAVRGLALHLSRAKPDSAMVTAELKRAIAAYLDAVENRR